MLKRLQECIFYSFMCPMKVTTEENILSGESSLDITKQEAKIYKLPRVNGVIEW